MLGLFKRVRIENWEIRLLKNIIENLPTDYKYLAKQIDDGLLRGVLIGMSDIPGYVGFSYNSNILTKYDKKEEKDFTITGIKVFDNQTKLFVNVVIYVSSGTISGYSVISRNSKFKLDPDRIDVTDFKKQDLSNPDFVRISKILNQEEIDLLNPSDVYIVNLNDRQFFHLKDLEDGDFIGIDHERRMYKITHDPFEVKLLTVGFLDFFKKDN